MPTDIPATPRMTVPICPALICFVILRIIGATGHWGKVRNSESNEAQANAGIFRGIASLIFIDNKDIAIRIANPQAASEIQREALIKGGRRCKFFLLCRNWQIIHR